MPTGGNWRTPTMRGFAPHRARVGRDDEDGHGEEERDGVRVGRRKTWGREFGR